jgi:glutamate-1-semialdehyde 2,1-aminomutase
MENTSMNAYLAPLALLVALAPRIKRRIELSRAKHRSLAGHSRMAKRLARWMPGYSLDEAEFFSCDLAPDAVVAQRKQAFFALARQLE